MASAPINHNTARTQYQRWREAGAAKGCADAAAVGLTETTAAAEWTIYRCGECGHTEWFFAEP